MSISMSRRTAASPGRVVAWLPSTPMLVPEITGDAGAAIGSLRAAVDAAVARAVRDDPAVITVIAPTDAPHLSDTGAWSWHGFGVGYRPQTETLPWQLGLGAWLLDRAGWHGQRCHVGVTAGREPSGRERRSPAVPDRGNLLVLGDGCAGLDEGTTPAVRDHARAWDDHLAAALTQGDPAQLTSLDAGTGTRLMASAATSYPVAGALLAGSAWQADLLYRAAPFDIGYLVAVWSS